MQTKVKKPLILTGILFLLFAILTVMIKTVDVQPIGPEQSEIGLATINQAVFEFFGVNPLWHDITSLLGVITIATAGGFAIFGLFQLIKRKSIFKVDRRLLLLAAFYFIVVVAYVFFEFVVVNYRPIILDQILEPSYPSSHTMNVICIMGTAMLQFHHYLKNKKSWIWITDFFSTLIILTTVVGRLVSGVHWFTDILGGVLLASALVALYYFVLKYTTPHPFQ